MQAPMLPNDDLHQKLETPADEPRPRRSSREPKKVSLLACTTGFNKRKRSTHFLKQSSQSTEEYPLTHNTGGEPGAGQDPEVEGESQNSRNELSYESDASASDSSEQGLGRRRENSRKLWTQTVSVILIGRLLCLRATGMVLNASVCVCRKTMRLWTW